ncbi:DUF6541 family protein [Brachybacterium saurashtrense]|uniref:Uncharacterized protein n=1 Tax=Brachybacterium saurashtrense TaxID=556288 RepID=A0A345YQ75_9MICO|nr:DUF6541 family protein [Brachybacterium saurashtrense]AXK46077.1 hypothetical protein DWV08_10960 [Brachybacterium saurashtrense]RRR23817.1 hypothetical protein DXU92_02710 [Brachybacterium saurashtrense]
MLTALHTLAALGAAGLVLSVPGIPLVLALRLRPLTALVAVVPASLLVITLAAEAGHLLSVPWTPLSPLLLAPVLGAALWPLRRRLGAGPEPEAVGPDAAHAAEHAAAVRSFATPLDALAASARGRAAAILTGAVIGGGAILVQALTVMGSVRAVSQTYDNVFHLNAVRHILRLGDASAWTVGGMTALPGVERFYPALWHQAVSLVVQLSGQEIPLASNVVMLLLAGVVWPLGLMALLRTCTTAGPLGWMAAGALAGVTGTFPLTMMSFGILLPYFLSMALMPMVMIVLVHLGGPAPDSPQRLRPAQVAVLLPVACGAAALAHPQAVFGGLVLGVPLLVWACLVRARERLGRGPGTGRRLWPLLTVTAGVLALAVPAWLLLRPTPGASFWTPTASVREAVGQTLSLAGNASPTWVPLGLVMLVCAAAVLRGSGSRWPLVPCAAVMAMSVLARSVPEGPMRYLLTGNWYSDTHRIVALLAVAAIPVLALGLEVLLRRAARSLPVLGGSASPVVAIAVVLALLVASLLSPSARTSTSFAAAQWQSDRLLSADERELLERLPAVVPEDAVIATNALNGSSLAYALSDREVLNVYMSFQAEPEVHLLNHALDEARTDPEVCEAAQELGVEYALDFGAREVGPGSATYLGLNEISQTGAAEVVLQVGEAKLLRMLPCRTTATRAGTA